MEFPDFARERAEMAVFRLASNNETVDALGMDKEDYRSVMVVKALENKEQLEHISDDKGRKKWLDYILRNQASDIFRKQKRHRMAMSRYTSKQATIPSSVSEDPESQCIQRDLLQRLRTALKASEWSLLVSYIEHGTASEAWMESNESMAKGTFTRKLRETMNTSREILRKISN